MGGAYCRDSGAYFKDDGAIWANHYPGELAGVVVIKSTVTGELFLGRFSNYTQLKMLEHIVGKTPFTKPTAYVALLTAEITEPSGMNYSRVATAGGDWNAAVNGEIDNTNAIAFPEASGEWGTISYYALFDAASGGNMLVYDELDTPKAINSAEIIMFGAGDLKLQLD